MSVHAPSPTPPAASEDPGSTTTDLARTRLSPGGLLHAEVVKLRSLRSTWVLAVVAVLFAAGGALLEALSYQYAVDAGEPLPSSAGASRGVLTAAIGSSQVVVAVLAVLVITAEHSSGAIQTTFIATPRRLPVLVAKTVVVATTAVILALIASAVAYLASLPLLTQVDLDADPASMTTTVAGGAFYLAVVAVFALLVGTIVRNTAAGVVTVLATIVVLPVALALAPGRHDFTQYLLTTGALDISAAISQPVATGLAAPLAVTAAWLTVAAVAAVVTLGRRDV